jgi:tetratricopeptide (TPR) repeat protein
MTDTMALCPDYAIEAAILSGQQNDEAGLSAIEILLRTYPSDPRLHFLRGSVLAGVQRYEEGRNAMREAVVIAPDFHLARFQLGFLELTSGLPAAAANTWEPFAELDKDAPFRLLSDGLNCLARNELSDADRLLRLGMAGNSEHPLINSDMQLLLDEVADKIRPGITSDDAAPASASAVHQMLQQFELKDGLNKTRH